MKNTILAISFFIFGWSAPLSAEVMTYQGRLKESNVPVNANRVFIFKFCDAETLGNCYTTPSGFQPFTVQNGLFKSTFAVPTSDLSQGAWYLQVSVGVDVPGIQDLSPRERLTAVPYSVYASTAGYSPAAVQKAGDTMTGQLTLSGSTLTVTGGAFSVGSSALVVNAGNIGIGTTTPAYRLVVSSGAGETGKIMTVSTGTTNIFSVDGYGVNALKFTGDGSGLTGVTGAAGTDSSKVLKAGDTMTGSLLMDAGSTITVTGSAFSVGGSTLVVSNGNVGIGTASPGRPLAIVTSAVSHQLQLTNTGTAGGYWDIGQSNSGFGSGGGSLVFTPDGVGSVNSVLVLKNAGNVGIGTTNPGAMLDVAGTGNFSGSLTTLSSGTFRAAGPGQFSVETGSGILVQAGRIQAPAIQLTNGAAANYVLTSDAAGNASWVNPVSGALGDGWVGNEIVDAADASLTRSGAGIAVDPYKLTLNLANANTWTAAQTFNAGLTGSLSGAASQNILRNGDSMTGPLTLAGSTLTVTGDAFSVGGATLVVKGGYLGVGTDAPGARLHVVSDNGYMHFASLSGPLTMNMIPQTYAAAILNNNGDGPLGFTIANDVKMWIDRQTLVGIGTQTPLYRLHVSSGAGETGTILAVSTGATNIFSVDGSGVNALRFTGDGSGLTGVTGASGTDSTKVLKAGDTMTGQLTNTSSVTITGNGGTYGLEVSSNVSLAGALYSANRNVGIGTATPAAALHLFSTSLSKSWITLETNAAPAGNTTFGVGIAFKRSAAAGSIALVEEPDYSDSVSFALGQWPWTRLVNIQQNGNIGIGTVYPGAKLDVAGIIRSTNTIYPGDGSSFQSSRGLSDDPAKFRTEFSSNVYMVGYSSAAKYYGDGSGLTGVSGTDDTKLPLAGGVMTGQLTNTSSITITGNGGAYGLEVSSNVSLAGVIYSANGNVGIGTTTPGAKLDIQQMSALGDMGILLRDNAAPLTRYTSIWSGTNGSVIDAKGALAGWGIHFSVNGFEKARITNTGNVGIGTMGPSYRLHVSSGAGEAGIIMAVSTGTSNIFSVDGSGVNALRFTGDGSGLTGVTGASGTDSSKLPLAGGTMTGQLTNTSSVTITGNGGAYGLQVSSNVSLAGALYSANGKVGIGTTNPSHEVQVHGTGADISRQIYVTRDTTVGGRSGITLAKTSGGGASTSAQGNIYYDHDNNQLRFDTDGNLRNIRIDGSNVLLMPSGSVGLGTTAPDQKLTVAGNISQTGVLISSGTGRNYFAGEVTAARYQIGGSTVLAVLPGTGSLGIGFDAGTANYGDGNLFVGIGAGKFNESGYGNSFLGTEAGYTNTTGLSNSFVGYYAGRANNFGGGNTFVGNQAGFNSDGDNNSFFGVNTGVGNSSGDNNVFIGAKAGFNAAGSNNIVIGYNKDTSQPAANNELNIGGVLYGDLTAKTIGISTRVPQAALDIVSTATSVNVYAQIWRDSTGLVVASMTSTGRISGDGSGLTGVSATDATKLPLGGGTLTGQLTLSGSTLTVTGNAFSVGGSTLVVDNGRVGIGTAGATYPFVIQTSVGTNTPILAVNSDAGTRIAYIGKGVSDDAQMDLADGTGNSKVFLDANGPSYFTGGSVGIGATAPDQKLTVAGNISQTGMLISSGTGKNYFAGDVTAARYQINGSTVVAVLPGSGSLGIGISAGEVDTGTDNSFLGYRAGYVNTSGGQNTFVGSNAGRFNTTGNTNSFFGYAAGITNTAGGDNAFFGNQTGASNTTGSKNTFMGGYAAGYGNTTGSASVIFGNEAGGAGGTGGNISSSTIMGYRAGFKLTNASDNILLGFQAGYNVTTGTGNILIGYGKDTSAPGASSELNIGGVLYGDLSARTIGISTRVPQAALDIVSTGTVQTQFAQIWRDSNGNIQSSMSATGVMMASKFVGDGSGLTGVYAPDATKLPLSGGNLTGSLTLSLATMTITRAGGTAFTVDSAGHVGINAFPDSSTGLYLGGAGIYEQGIKFGAMWALHNNANVLTITKTSGATYPVMTINTTGDTAVTTGKFTVGGSTLAVVNRTVGINLAAPQAALDIVSTATASNVYAQIWRDGAGVATASVTSQGRFSGDGSGLTGVSAVDSSKLPLAGGMLTGGLTVTGASITVNSSDGQLMKLNSNATYAGVSFYYNDTTQNGVLGFGNNGGIFIPAINGAMGLVGYSGLHLGATSKAALTITNLDKVGIGTISPLYTLDISTTNDTDAYVLRAGVNGIVISTGGAITTAGVGHGTVNGNARGVGAVDLQSSRSAATYVASGYFSVIGGGRGNTSSSFFTTVAGGQNNIASGDRASVLGGEGNTASAYTAVVAGGNGNTASGGYSIVGGGASNQSSNGWTTVAGGAGNIASQNYATVGGGSSNNVSAYSGTVAGGYGNKVLSLANAGFIGGGENNISTGAYSTVGGGRTNTSSGAYASVLGGQGNVAQGANSSVGGGSSNLAYGANSAVSGGKLNNAWGDNSTVAGGQSNEANTTDSIVAGGSFNSASGLYSAVVGGNLNKAMGTAAFIGAGGSNQAKGWGAVAFGGNNASMGGFSFAAGYRSTSAVDGTFTWSDSQGFDVVNNIVDQVMFKAKGGFWVSTGTVYTDPGLFVDANNRVGIGTAVPTAKLHIGGTPGVDGIRFPDGTLMTTAGVGSANNVASITDAVINGDSDGNMSGSVKLQTSGLDRVYVSTGGQVGIGTTNPSVRFHNAGSAILADITTIDPDSYGNAVIAGGFSDGGWNAYAVGGKATNAGTTWGIGHNNADLLFAAGDSTNPNTLQTFMQATWKRNLALVPVSGKVGIGTSVIPDQKLTVIGNISQTGVLISSGTGNNYFAGNVGIGTNTPVAMLDVNGTARLGRSVVESRDAGGTMSADDFGKTITVNSASQQGISLPVGTAGSIGAQFTFVKLGTGRVTIVAGATDFIADSSMAGMIYNDAVSPAYATITLRLVTSNQWMLVGGEGAWVTQ